MLHLRTALPRIITPMTPHYIRTASPSCRNAASTCSVAKKTWAEKILTLHGSLWFITHESRWDQRRSRGGQQLEEAVSQSNQQTAFAESLCVLRPPAVRGGHCCRVVVSGNNPDYLGYCLLKHGFWSVFSFAHICSKQSAIISFPEQNS